MYAPFVFIQVWFLKTHRLNISDDGILHLQPRLLHFKTDLLQPWPRHRRGTLKIPRDSADPDCTVSAVLDSWRLDRDPPAPVLHHAPHGPSTPLRKHVVGGGRPWEHTDTPGELPSSNVGQAWAKNHWLAESFVRQSLQPGCHQWAQEWIHWKVKIRISSILLGGLEHEWIITFPSYWEFHHPNWRTHIFQRGRAQPPTRFWPFQVFVGHFTTKHGFSWDFHGVTEWMC